MSNMQRRKGNRIETEIVNAHKEMGIHAERVPFSGGTHFRGEGHDVDVYVFGKDEAPAVAEVKARAEGRGFALLERWLAEYDLLFLRRDRQDPLVVMPWNIWVRLLRCVVGYRKPEDLTSWLPEANAKRPAATSEKPEGTAGKERSNGRAEAR